MDGLDFLVLKISGQLNKMVVRSENIELLYLNFLQSYYLNETQTTFNKVGEILLVLFIVGMLLFMMALQYRRRKRKIGRPVSVNDEVETE